MEVTNKKAKCDQSDPGGHISENPALHLGSRVLGTLDLKNGRRSQDRVWAVQFIQFFLLKLAV